MRTVTCMAGTLLLALAATPAVAQTPPADPAPANPAMRGAERPPADALTPPPPPGWNRPEIEPHDRQTGRSYQPWDMGAGRQSGAPAGDALARPAAPSTGTPAAPGDGDTATADTPTFGRDGDRHPRPPQPGAAGDESYSVKPGADSAGRSKPIEPAWKPVGEPPYPDPAR